MAKTRTGILQIPGFFKQMGCVMVLSGGMICNGTGTTWPAVLPKVMNESNGEYTEEDTQWIISVFSLSGIFVPVLAGALMELLGSRRMVTIITIPTMAFTVLIAYAPSKTAMLIGRIGTGLTGGMMNTILVPFISELVSPEIRGLLTSVLRVQLSIGVVLMTIMAKFLNWSLATVLTVVPLVPVFFLLFLVPESPFWLAKHGRDDEALKSLSLRGSKENARKELDKIKKGIEEQPSFSTKDQFVLLKESSNYVPILIMISVNSTLLMGGMGVVIQYSVFIFDEADVGLDPFTCTVLLAVARLMGSLLSFAAVDRVGRRPLYLGASLICSLSLVLCGISFIIPTVPNWIIMASLIIFVLSQGTGPSVLMPLLTSEIIPTPVRSIGVSICVTITFALFFVASLTFLPMVEAMGWGYTFLLLAAFNATSMFIFWWKVPETRGRSLVELQNLFIKPKRNGEIIIISKPSHQNGNEFHKGNLEIVHCEDQRTKF
ncbi:facilitated trehalose transporter Tret1-like [Oratosquilla oratoria]|uniref:facilitated trehalose transporter Tret1-like n=1 Tax=Oratosquilla oratoria TaxID=337810 RepID=UPI003F75FB2D